MSNNAKFIPYYEIKRTVQGHVNLPKGYFKVEEVKFIETYFGVEPRIYIVNTYKTQPNKSLEKKFFIKERIGEQTWLVKEEKVIDDNLENKIKQDYGKVVMTIEGKRACYKSNENDIILILLDVERVGKLTEICKNIPALKKTKIRFDFQEHLT